MRGLTRPQAAALMVAVTLMWSIAGLVSRQLEQARSFEVTFWRSLFTVLTLLALAAWPSLGLNLRAIAWRSRALWVSSVCWAVMFTAFMVALTLTSVANVLITLAIGPLLTALAARLFIGHRLQAYTWAAIVLAGAGIAYMFASQVRLDGAAAHASGMLVALCVPIAGAVQWTLTQHGQMQQEKPDLVPAVLLGAALSVLFTLPLAFPFSATGRDVAWLALLGSVQLAIPCALSVICARALKAPEVSLLALLEVVFGITLVWAFAGEAPQASVLIGGLMVIAALIGNELLSWSRAKS